MGAVMEAAAEVAVEEVEAVDLEAAEDLVMVVVAVAAEAA